MNKIKLSFIVPVYNVAPYLRKCVDSVLNQDLSSSEYEIILVDDGSPDGCPAICDQYAAEHDNIRVIHRKNGGLSAARNSGIEVAQGEYVMFVDSDDYLEPNVLGGLMEQVERDNLDVLRFDYQNVRVVDAEHIDVTRLEPKAIDAAHLDYEVFEPNKTPRYIDKCNEVVDGETYLNTRMGYACYAVMFIMRREIVPEFTEGIHFEDVDWLPRMMLKAERVASVDTIVYNYLIRKGSITQIQGNKEKIQKNLDNRMKIIETYSVYIKQHPACKWLKNMQSSMVAGVLTTIAMEFYANKEYIERLKVLKVFPLTIANQGRTYVRRARIINFLSPRIYCAIMHLR